MKEIDWLMLVPMGFMGAWITVMIKEIIKGVKYEQENDNEASAGTGVQ